MASAAMAQGAKLGVEAIDFGKVGNPRRKFFGGAEVRSIKNEKRRVMTRTRTSGRYRCCCAR